MADVGLKELLQAGVHFGHQTSRWNPKMRKYIFAERSGIYLLDLKKTLRQLDRAREEIRKTVEAGKSVLFVCTKPQLSEIVETEARRCGAFYVTERWVGGMLTNFQTIKNNIRRLKELEQGFEENAFEYYTKKERILLDRERQKLERYLTGIKDMTSLPGLVYVVDAAREEIAVKEADRLDIPMVAIADTNADPDPLDIPIPGNDDALRAVSLITRAIADEVEKARSEVPDARVTETEGTFTYSSDVGEKAEGAPSEPSDRKKKRPKRRPRPEVIAKRRQAQEDEEEGEPEEAEGREEPVAEAEGAPEAAEEEQPEASADEDVEPEASADEEASDEDAEEETEEVPVSAAAGGAPEEEEEEPSS